MAGRDVRVRSAAARCNSLRQQGSDDRRDDDIEQPERRQRDERVGEDPRGQPAQQGTEQDPRDGLERCVLRIRRLGMPKQRVKRQVGKHVEQHFEEELHQQHEEFFHAGQLRKRRDFPSSCDGVEVPRWVTRFIQSPALRMAGTASTPWAPASTCRRRRPGVGLCLLNGTAPGPRDRNGALLSGSYLGPWSPATPLHHNKAVCRVAVCSLFSHRTSRHRDQARIPPGNEMMRRMQAR